MRWNAIAQKVLVLVVVLVGASLASASEDLRVPLSPSDRAQLDKAFALEIPWTPQLLKSLDGRPVLFGVMLFDGTRNDRLKVPVGERETVVAHLRDDMVDNRSVDFLQYYRGTGTQSDWFIATVDAMDGYTMNRVAVRAVDEAIEGIDKSGKLTPDTDVRILVSGFSRGSATARHFMNLFEERWQAEHRPGTPRFYALIFDTVATGQRTKLELQVPASADLFYHFVSLDERRMLFKPVLDIPEDGTQGRVVTLPMPGVHSDIGASYALGVGSEYTANVDAILSAMGLLPPGSFTVNGDARAQGKNDSRWFIERLQGIGSPNTESAQDPRTAFFVHAAPVPVGFASDWRQRMLDLEFNGAFSNPRSINRTELEPPTFVVTRSGNDFNVVGSSLGKSVPAEVVLENQRYFIQYRLDQGSPSKVEIARATLDRIANGGSGTLSLGLVENGDGSEMRVWWFLGNERVQEIEGTFHRGM